MRPTHFLATVGTAALATTSLLGVLDVAPVAAAPAPLTIAVAPEANAALDWLETELAAGGGSMPSPYTPGDSDWGLTLDTVLALGAGGRASGAAATTALAAVADHIGDYVTGNAFADPGVYGGPVGKALLTVRLAGADPTSFGGVDLEALSRAAVQTAGVHEGRFSDQGSLWGDFSNGLGQALNVMALSGTTAGVPASAVDFLLAQQCPAGGFRMSYDQAPVTRSCTADTEADSDATALSVQALLALEPGEVRDAAVAGATTWLVDHLDPATGGIGGTGLTAVLNSNTSGLTAQALAAAGLDADAARVTSFVRSLQLDPARTTSTPAAPDLGAIAYDQAAFDEAVTGGVAPLARDTWRRATAQAVLAFGLPPFVQVQEEPEDLVAVEPARLLDTRPGGPTSDGTGSGAGAATNGSTTTLTLTGRAGIPADAAAVVLTITAIGTTGNGYVTAYACDQPRPGTSNVNFTPDTAAPGTVITPPSATGTICLYTAGAEAHLLADVTGYFPADSRFGGIAPARLLDTRPGGPTSDGTGSGAGAATNGSTTTLTLTGRAGIPADAAAVVLTITAIGTTGNGYVTAYACDQPRPGTSNVNFTPDTAAPGTVITPLSATGTICLYTAGAEAHLLADVTGYFPADSRFGGIAPARLLDTRPGGPTSDGTGSGAGAATNGSTTTLTLTGRAGIPADAAAVVLTITAIGTTGNGYVTAYACDQPRPGTSNVNFTPDTAAPGTVVTPLSATGTICLYTAGAEAHLLADVTGTFV